MNFQPASKSLTLRDYIFIAVVVLVIVAISAGLVIANLSLPRGGGEFLRHWVGARAYLFQRIDPYTTYVPEAVQSMVYGRPAREGEKPYILDTPFHILVLYFPLALFSEPGTARAVYTLILEWALFALAYISLRLTEWSSPRWFVVLFFLFCFINLYSFQALTEASPALMVGLIYAGILLSLLNDADEMVGALLAVSVYYWEVGLPYLVLIIWLSYRKNRGRVFAGFGMFSFALLALSFLLYPGWLIPALRAGVNNFRTGFGFSTITVLDRVLPDYGKTFAWGLLVLLVLILGYEWNASQYGDSRRVYWTACLTLAVTPLLGFRTGLENLAVLVIPLALVFSIVHDRWKRAGTFLMLLIFGLLFAGPWTLYYFFFSGFNELTGITLFLFLPVFTVIGLYWIRWWAIRPPRVWADSVSNK